MQFRLLVQGNDFYSDLVLFNGTSITYGRTDITTQPSPATFSTTLSGYATEFTNPIFLNDPITYQVFDDASSMWINLFSGRVSDVSASIGAWGNGDGLVEYQITGVGHLAEFNRKNVGVSGYTKKTDALRLEDILFDTGSDLVIEYSDPAGVYEIAAVSNGDYDALQLMQDTANSAMGVLIDTPNDPDTTNPVTYTTYTDRSSLGTIALTIDDVIANGFTIRKSMNDIVSEAWVTYGSSGSNQSTKYTEITISDVSASRTTYLHNLSDANSVAQILLAARTDELYRLDNISINLDTITDAGLLASLYGIRNGQQITIDSLPFTDFTNFQGFVEGWSWQINKNGTTLNINVSSYGQNYPYTMWNNLGGTADWNTIYTATTTWEDIV